MNELTITKERVLKAAKGSPEAERALKTLFPDVFKSEYFDLTKLDSNELLRIFSKENLVASGVEYPFMQIRCVGSHAWRAFYLSDNIDWSLERDERNVLCLVPRRKR